ncbi:8707_t:CDS:2 [Funneliformis geosporum]|uniref:8707_t:CDS:1 n=1 Tax=Funneliformis geosporum TaxID=1117311 RepID=A0A9W4SQJ7_9GLOM|nr:8707_t:CDS:2 [Funneliformis geosporum]
MTNEVHELTSSKSFKCCDISVKSNSSEDDMIFNYDNLAIDKENKENDELIGNDKFREEDYNN